MTDYSGDRGAVSMKGGIGFYAFNTPINKENVQFLITMPISFSHVIHFKQFENNANYQ